MSDAIDRAFEDALVRSMGGENPVESLKLTHVSALAFKQQEIVKVAIFEEDRRWAEKLQKFMDDNVSPDNVMWLDAVQVHHLLMDSYMSQLKLLQKVGNPRGF